MGDIRLNQATLFHIVCQSYAHAASYKGSSTVPVMRPNAATSQCYSTDSLTFVLSHNIGFKGVHVSKLSPEALFKSFRSSTHLNS